MTLLIKLENCCRNKSTKCNGDDAGDNLRCHWIFHLLHLHLYHHLFLLLLLLGSIVVFLSVVPCLLNPNLLKKQENQQQRQKGKKEHKQQTEKNGIKRMDPCVIAYNMYEAIARLCHYIMPSQCPLFVFNFNFEKKKKVWKSTCPALGLNTFVTHWHW